MRRCQPRTAPAPSRVAPQVIAIDGPSGAGKSSASRLLAERLGWRVFETGTLYRAVAWAVLSAGLDPADQPAVERRCAELTLELVPTSRPRTHGAAGWQVEADGRLLGEELREEAVTQAASVVAAIPAVRARLLAYQRALLLEGRIVMEGRDIGTVVCPEAPAKFFLDAAPSVRGRRRFHEQPADAAVSPRRTSSAMHERDQRDQRRPVAPLRPAADAVRIDTTSLTLEQVVDKMMAVVKSRKILLSSGRLRRLPRR
jgi:cytidylate kinase